MSRERMIDEAVRRMIWSFEMYLMLLTLPHDGSHAWDRKLAKIRAEFHRIALAA